MAEDNPLIDQLGDFVKERKFSDIVSSLKEERNQELIQSDALCIVSIFCSLLKEDESILKDSSNFDSCSEILNILAENGNAKEVLLGLLEAADSFKEDEFFQLVLTPIQRVLMRVPGKRGKSLEWVLSVLDAHIVSLPLPENRDFEGEELLLLDLDPNVHRTAYSVSSYLKFIDPFIKEVSFDFVEKNNIVYSDRISSQREILQKYLLKLLDRPLLYHDLHVQPNRELSSLQVRCQKILTYLSQMTRNFVHLLLVTPFCKPHDNQSVVGNSAEVDEQAVSSLACANFMYLIFAEGLFPHCRPYVYSYVYLLEKHLHLIITLLEKNENLVLYKGLHLCKALLDRIQPFTLPGQHASSDKHVQLSIVLLNIAIHCPVESYRKMSVSLFTTYIKSFTWQIRYSHLMCVIDRISHSGVQGYLISLYKNFLNDSLNENGASHFFCGRNLHAFVRNALHLDDGAKTDILENYDKIVSSLNFLRFLVLRDDKKKNITGIWDIIMKFSKDYLEPLHRGIEFTRAHYQLEKQILREHKSSGDNINATVTVNGELMPNVPPHYKSDVIGKALVSLDMVVSILSRLKEVLDK